MPSGTGVGQAGGRGHTITLPILPEALQGQVWVRSGEGLPMKDR